MRFFQDLDQTPSRPRWAIPRCTYCGCSAVPWLECMPSWWNLDPLEPALATPGHGSAGQLLAKASGGYPVRSALERRRCIDAGPVDGDGHPGAGPQRGPGAGSDNACCRPDQAPMTNSASLDRPACLTVCAVRHGLPTLRGDRRWLSTPGGHRAGGRRVPGEGARLAQTPLACASSTRVILARPVPDLRSEQSVHAHTTRGAVGPDLH
jgi:hypothetical protein